MPSLFAQPEHLKRSYEYSKPAPKGQAYAVAIPNSEKPDRSKIYRHWKFQNGLAETLDPAVRTAHDIFEGTANRLPHYPCLGYRPYNASTKTWGNYEWIEYSTVQNRRAHMGVGLVELHRREGITDSNYGIGLWCQNRPEWQITDLAAMSQGLYTVSLYDTLGPDASEYIIKHANLACVVTSLPHIPILLKLKSRLPNLKLIISLDSLEAGEAPGLSKKDLLILMAAEVDIKIFSIEEVEALGESLNRPYNPPQPSDIITINYTSGTTGPPKGVVLTQRAAVAGYSSMMTAGYGDHNDAICSYLPLAHIYERLTEGVALWCGSRIGYFHGNVLELVDDFKALRPTSLTSVPRLYNRFGGAIRAGTLDAPGFRGTLSRHVVATKTANLKSKTNPTSTHALYDRIWGRKVTAQLGLDRVHTMVSGSAPLDPNLHTFLRVVWGSRVCQGYGLTETYAGSMAQLDGDMTVGNCGTPLAGIEACLLSVPDMSYLVTDTPQPRGELLLRGPTLFSGYYKNPDETAKAMTSDGWFKTGDIASVDAMGRFSIIDRRKNVLKLAQGEYISPERIEGVYLNACKYLAQAFVHGDSVQTFLVAILGIQADLFAPFASKILNKQIEATDIAALEKATKDPRVRDAVLRDLDRVGRKSKFAGYERVKNCYLYVEPFSIENELLTPTLKLKRQPAAKKYRKELDQLYAEALEWESRPKAKL